MTKPFKKLAFHGDDPALMMQQFQDHVEEWINDNTFAESDDLTEETSGMVVGPTSSTDNALARFNGSR